MPEQACSRRDNAAIVQAAHRDVPIILLDHQPREARNAAKLGVALQLSGHTHGGLIVGIDRLAAGPNGDSCRAVTTSAG